MKLILVIAVSIFILSTFISMIDTTHNLATAKKALIKKVK